MPASALRLQIERALESRFPAALSPPPRQVREVASTGIREADRILDGGLPVGAISEITGPACSGRTSLALALVAQRSAEERVSAWVDTSDTFDPESAAANGVDLRQLLWVRCSDEPARSSRIYQKLDQALRATDLLLQTAGFAAIVLDLGDIAAEYAYRIPLATWFRFRQAADRTRCSLVVLGQVPYAQSSAAVALECEPLHPETAGSPASAGSPAVAGSPARAGSPASAGSTVLRGFTFKLQRARQRFSAIHAGPRKPPASTWSAGAPWSATGGVPQVSQGSHGQVLVPAMEVSILRPGRNEP